MAQLPNVIPLTLERESPKQISDHSFTDVMTFISARFPIENSCCVGYLDFSMMPSKGRIEGDGLILETSFLDEFLGIEETSYVKGKPVIETDIFDLFYIHHVIHNKESYGIPILIAEIWPGIDSAYLTSNSHHQIFMGSRREGFLRFVRDNLSANRDFLFGIENSNMLKFAVEVIKESLIFLKEFGAFEKSKYEYTQRQNVIKTVAKVLVDSRSTKQILEYSSSNQN